MRAPEIRKFAARKADGREGSALILAVLAVLMPASALLGLTIIFGAFSMVDGIFSLIAAFRNIRAGEKWGWLAFNGVVGIGTGIVVLITPMMASFVLSLFFRCHPSPEYSFSCHLALYGGSVKRSVG